MAKKNVQPAKEEVEVDIENIKIINRQKPNLTKASRQKLSKASHLNLR